MVNEHVLYTVYQIWSFASCFHIQINKDNGIKKCLHCGVIHVSKRKEERRNLNSREET